MLKLTSNPWDANEAPQVWHAIAVLAASQSRCAEITKQFPAQRKAIDAFKSDLQFLEAAYREDVRSYRATRVLTAVHLPALFECLKSFYQSTEAAGPEIDQTLALAFKIASDSRETVSRTKLDSAKIALETIEDTVAGKEVVEQKTSGWLNSIAGSAQETVRKSLNPVTAAVGSGYSKVTQDAGRRLSGLSSYATTAASGAIDEALALVLTPVNTHLGALRSAVRTAAGAAALDSVLIAILYPPALPLAVGAGILEGSASYSKHLAEERNKEATRRARTRSDRNEQSKRALDKVLGRSPIVSLSSPHLYVTIDTDQDIATGTILSGKFIGLRLEDIGLSDIRSLIKHAPDDDTRIILTAWERRKTGRA
tara:strand:+ start:1856 stop:2959 length:1104 start_codon:yes stop_codon:yes gene_type:complete